MWFPSDVLLERIQSWVAQQYGAVSGRAKHGFDVELRPHRRQRSNEQNRFLHAILQAMVVFYRNTGFVPAGLSPWAMQVDVLKVYWKSRYGIQTTRNLTTAEFTKFIDFIQLTMVEESNGCWEILTTDSQYLKSLEEYYG
ncbi:MAG: hypothetical protein II208_00515 [Alphaproteobacteria bacterium]|nr:hypothetical protein [Alphaproteobacteria bacterium]